MKGSLSARLRHYLGLHGAKAKFSRLLGEFDSQPLGAFVTALAEQPLRNADESLLQISPEALFSTLANPMPKFEVVETRNGTERYTKT